jgi:glycosyltransferase involved in cell wall biosynthesis
VNLTVAIDASPLHGPRTGIGNAVAWTIDALRSNTDIDVRPYVTSMRARLSESERRLPIPAAAALTLWARRSPPVDRWLGHPDVVHGTNYVVPPARAIRVVTVYDCWFLDHPDDALPDVRRAAQVLRHAVDEGAHVVTSSDATTRRVRELLDTKRVRTILLGPPVLEADRRNRAESIAQPRGLPDLTTAPFVVSIGTLERRKNMPTLVAAFGRLAREHPTVRLVMAGAIGNDAEAVNRAIARLEPEIAGRVMRTGAVDVDTKLWLLEHARALAYPSLDEGFGFPILEAQQLGTPVVASTAGSIPQIAGAAALLSPPLDAEALAANLYWVVSNDEMYAKLVRRGHSNVLRFSWADTARHLDDTYRQLVDDRQDDDEDAEAS